MRKCSNDTSTLWCVARHQGSLFFVVHVCGVTCASILFSTSLNAEQIVRMATMKGWKGPKITRIVLSWNGCVSVCLLAFDKLLYNCAQSWWWANESKIARYSFPYISSILICSRFVCVCCHVVLVFNSLKIDCAEAYEWPSNARARAEEYIYLARENQCDRFEQKLIDTRQNSNN